VQESGTGVDVVLTNTGYTAVFGNKTNDRVSGSGTSLITAITTYSPDGKNISKYDTNLLGYWDMETIIQNGTVLSLKDYSYNDSTSRIINNTSLNIIQP